MWHLCTPDLWEMLEYVYEYYYHVIRINIHDERDYYYTISVRLYQRSVPPKICSCYCTVARNDHQTVNSAKDCNNYTDETLLAACVLVAAESCIPQKAR